MLLKYTDYNQVMLKSNRQLMPGNFFKYCVDLASSCSLMLVTQERVIAPKDETSVVSAGVYATSGGPLKSQQLEGSENAQDTEQGMNRSNCSDRNLLKSASISASQCVIVKENKDNGEEPISETTEEAVDGLSEQVAAL